MSIGGVDRVGDVPHDLGQLRLLLHHLFYPLDGVEDCGVMAVAELLADRGYLVMVTDLSGEAASAAAAAQKKPLPKACLSAIPQRASAMRKPSACSARVLNTF